MWTSSRTNHFLLWIRSARLASRRICATNELVGASLRGATAEVGCCSSIEAASQRAAHAPKVPANTLQQSGHAEHASMAVTAKTSASHRWAKRPDIFRTHSKTCRRCIVCKSATELPTGGTLARESTRQAG